MEYADPVTAVSYAEVGSYELGASEIIENCDNLAMTIDLSKITIPDNCCFESVTVDAGRVVNMRPHIIGAEQASRAGAQSLVRTTARARLHSRSIVNGLVRPER